MKRLIYLLAIAGTLGFVSCGEQESAEDQAAAEQLLNEANNSASAIDENATIEEPAAEAVVDTQSTQDATAQ